MKKKLFLIFAALIAWTAAVAHLAYWTGVEDTAMSEREVYLVPHDWPTPVTPEDVD